LKTFTTSTTLTVLIKSYVQSTALELKNADSEMNKILKSVKR